METYLRQRELAARWRVSERALERWRWTGKGPAYVKIGGAVRYRLSDIEEYERLNTHFSVAAGQLTK